MGHPVPRIAEFPDPLDDRQRKIYERIKTGPRGRVRGPLALWLYSPDIAERAQSLGEYLRYGSVFVPCFSELIILIVAAHYRCQFEWSVHASIAERNGVKAVVIEALRTNQEPQFDNSDEALVHRFCAALLRTNRVDDATFARFRERFGERGIVELTTIMGYYAMGAFLLNAVAYETPDAPQPFDNERHV
jgi:4-carboxymuconolactone decarboxylase